MGQFLHTACADTFECFPGKHCVHVMSQLPPLALFAWPARHASQWPPELLFTPDRKWPAGHGSNSLHVASLATAVNARAPSHAPHSRSEASVKFRVTYEPGPHVVALTHDVAPVCG